MLKSHVRLLVTMLAAVCCFFIARSAVADAPRGGYRVVRTTKDAVVLEVGVGLSTRTLAQDFGPQFKTSTGAELATLDGLQKFQALNPHTTIPVCETRGDGPIFKGAEHLEVWQSCPLPQQTLWLIARRTVEIPLVRVEVETFADKWARLQRADACATRECVVANLSKKARALLEQKSSISNTSPSAAPTPATMAGVASIFSHAASTSASAQVPVAGSPQSPQTVNPPSFMGLNLVYLVIITSLVAGILILWSKLVDVKEQIAALKVRLANEQGNRNAAERALRTVEDRDREFRGHVSTYFGKLAKQLGANLAGAMTCAGMYADLSAALGRRLRDHARAEQKLKLLVETKKLEPVNAPTGAFERDLAAMRQKLAEAEARAERLAKIGDGREKELAQTRDALERAERALQDIGVANAQYRNTLEKLADDNAGIDQELVSAKRERDELLAALFPDTADGQHPALSNASVSGNFDRVDTNAASRASIPPVQAADWFNWMQGFLEEHRNQALCLKSSEELRHACALANLPVTIDRAMLDQSLGADGVHTQPVMQRLLARANLMSLPYLARRMHCLAPQPAQASA